MPELSKFNALPFIAHKNMSLPLCALDKLRDTCTSPAPTVEPNDPVYRDDQPERMDACAIVEQQAHAAGLEQTNINDKDINVVQTNEGDEVVVIDAAGLEQTNINDKDINVVQTNEGDEVVVIDGTDTTAEQQPINNNGNTNREIFSPSSEMRVKCTKDGAWLICESDDESNMTASSHKNANVPPSRPENICWKCAREGGALLLIFSRSECAAKVHKECLNCQVHFDEDDDNFHCPVCWYDRMTMEYHELHKLMSCAKRRFVKFSPLLSKTSKRLR